MKLNATNSKFAVVKTSFHGGGIISFHNSLAEAEKAEHNHQSGDCQCGCCGIVPVNVEGAAELKQRKDRDGYPYYVNEIPTMYADLPMFEPGKYHYRTLCK